MRTYLTFQRLRVRRVFPSLIKFRREYVLTNTMYSNHSLSYSSLYLVSYSCRTCRATWESIVWSIVDQGFHHPLCLLLAQSVFQSLLKTRGSYLGVMKVAPNVVPFTLTTVPRSAKRAIPALIPFHPSMKKLQLLLVPNVTGILRFPFPPVMLPAQSRTKMAGKSFRLSLSGHALSTTIMIQHYDVGHEQRGSTNEHTRFSIRLDRACHSLIIDK